jgi:Chaperone of endosialidase
MVPQAVIRLKQRLPFVYTFTQLNLPNMKPLSKITVLAIVLCTGAVPLLAQPDAIKIIANGNVGIGNDGPAAKLHVGVPLNGTAMSTTFITNAGSLAKSNQSELPLASIGFISGNSIALGIRALRTAATADSGWGTTAIGLGMDVDNSIRVNASGLWFSANGHIGIGTAIPQKALDIASPGGIRLSRTEGLSGNASNNEIFFQDNGQIRSADDNHRIIFNRSNNIMELREFGDIVFSPGTTQSVVMKPNGNVGMGIPNPLASLHVSNTTTPVSFTLGGHTNNGGYTALVTRLSSVKDGYAYIQSIKAAGTAWGDIILNKDGGNIGIGTTSPTQAKLVINGNATGNDLPLNDQLTLYNQVSRGTTGKKDLSLYATDGIAAKIIYLFSDERIKTAMHPSNGAEDLQNLMQIAVTDFRYKDLMRGSGIHKKLIAQQVEKVYPQAVTTNTDVVPDIYQKAVYKDGWIWLPNDLKKGERVKLITTQATAVYEVLEATAKGFRTDCTCTSNELFVYGREVTDFRMVDYESIAMLNVSATQQLAKLLETLTKENAAMRKRLDALEAAGLQKDNKIITVAK